MLLFTKSGLSISPKFIYTPLKKEYIAWHDCPSVKLLTNTNSTSESDSEDENRIRDGYTTTFPFFSKHQNVPETALGQWLYMSQCYSTPFMRLQKGVIAR
jgi:hypothetical protein